MTYLPSCHPFSLPLYIFLEDWFWSQLLGLPAIFPVSSCHRDRFREWVVVTLSRENCGGLVDAKQYKNAVKGWEHS